MKANEAPEKLYVSVGDAILDIYSKKESDEEIEYTRTDAFIEKASTFLCSCIEDCMARYMETWNPEMKAKTIENFKNYMKL